MERFSLNGFRGNKIIVSLSLQVFPTIGPNYDKLIPHF